MDSTMKYRTYGSLPISAQKQSQYIPRIPEQAASDQGKVKQDAASFRGQTDESGQQSPSKMKAPTIQAPAPPRYKMPPHDPCKAIIETSPYYVYFKVVTTNNGSKSPEQDIRKILSQLVIIDKDLPRTAKYRHFRSYAQ